MPGIKIKICGLRRIEDIEYANMLMPDYTGFSLAEGFRRSITRKQAENFAARLDSKIKRAGVFVNQPEHVVADYVNSGIIQYVQLHGDEDNNYIYKLGKCIHKEYKVIKTVKARCAKNIEMAAGYKCDYLLCDAYSPGQAGGSGVAFDWTLVKNINKPFFLAGGISASNVKEAVELVKPYAVDASSSMETDGFKDFNKMKEFVGVIRKMEVKSEK